MTRCQHLTFEGQVDVARIEDAGQPLRFMVDLAVTCADCKEKFRFLGLPAGLSFEAPHVDVTGTTLTAPIEPELVPMLHSKLRFDMPPVIP